MFQKRRLDVEMAEEMRAHIEEARAQMASLVQRLEQNDPGRNTGWTVTVHRLLDDIFKNYRKSLWLLMGAAAWPFFSRRSGSTACSALS